MLKLINETSSKSWVGKACRGSSHIILLRVNYSLQQEETTLHAQTGSAATLLLQQEGGFFFGSATSPVNGNTTAQPTKSHCHLNSFLPWMNFFSLADDFPCPTLLSIKVLSCITPRNISLLARWWDASWILDSVNKAN